MTLYVPCDEGAAAEVNGEAATQCAARTVAALATDDSNRTHAPAATTAAASTKALLMIESLNPFMEPSYVLSA